MRKFFSATRANGDNFAEYNSSTYTVVAIEDLTRIFDEIDDPDVHTWAGDMLEVAWSTAARYFHAPTRQWCGPNSRSYQWLTSPATLSFLQLGLDDSVRLIDEEDFAFDLEWAYVDIRCPDRFRDAFVRCKQHDICETFTTADGGLNALQSTACAHLCERYALGSWRSSITWNQRRDLLAYWGSAQPRFMNATLLHNMYDFSSGMLTVAQQGGSALAIAGFCTDGGDTHCHLDAIQCATIRAYDLRLRFEFGGALTEEPRVIGNTAELYDDDMRITLRLLGAQFDGRMLSFTLTDSDTDAAIQDAHGDLRRRFNAAREKRYSVDLVFYSGDEQEIRLDALRSAYAVVCLSMDGLAPREFSLTEAGDFISARAQMGSVHLEASCPSHPMPRVQWRSSAGASNA